jgi:holo-[acyl-carrier protein] synthase
MAKTETIIGTGTDIAEVQRLKKAIEKWGKSFTGRIFTGRELEYAGSKSNKYIHLAGRFAAKEAVFKAVGNKNLTFKDIEIINTADGKPLCRFTTKKAPGIKVHISISHVKNYAVANAIATKKT